MLPNRCLRSEATRATPAAFLGPWGPEPWESKKAQMTLEAS